jgi:hypothetical protein
MRRISPFLAHHRGRYRRRDDAETRRNQVNVGGRGEIAHLQSLGIGFVRLPLALNHRRQQPHAGRSGDSERLAFQGAPLAVIQKVPTVVVASDQKSRRVVHKFDLSGSATRAVDLENRLSIRGFRQRKP